MLEQWYTECANAAPTAAFEKQVAERAKAAHEQAVPSDAEVIEADAAMAEQEVEDDGGRAAEEAANLALRHSEGTGR